MPQTQNQPTAAQAKLSRFNPRAHELKNPGGVSFGGKAYLNLASGPTYQCLLIKSDALDSIRRISVTRNGTEFVSATIEELRNLETEQKIYKQDDRIMIPFADYKMRAKAGIRETELVTLPGEDFYVYVEFGAKPEGFEGVAPSLSIRAYTTPAQPARYYMPHLISDTWDHPKSGQCIIEYANKNQNLFIKRMFFKCENNDIEKIEVLRDNRVEFEVTKEDNSYDLACMELEEPKGVMCLDFVMFGLAADGKLETNANQNFQFRITKTTPGPIQVFQQISEVVQVA